MTKIIKPVERKIDHKSKASIRTYCQILLMFSVYRPVIAAPVHGHWGCRSSWSSCDVSCGNSIRSRWRLCEDPPPRYGGKTCSGIRWPTTVTAKQKIHGTTNSTHGMTMLSDGKTKLTHGSTPLIHGKTELTHGRTPLIHGKTKLTHGKTKKTS